MDCQKRLVGRVLACCALTLSVIFVVSDFTFAQPFETLPQSRGAPYDPNRSQRPLPPQGRPGQRPNQAPTLVAGIRITGNQSITKDRIQTMLKTRPDRQFDPEMVQADVRELIKSGLFRDVKTFTEQTPRGILVTFQVFELPTITEIKVMGNRKLRDKTLLKQTGLKVGDTISAFRVNEARRKIEEFYRTKGYPKSQVSVFEGNKPGDRRVVFVVSEDQLQRIWEVKMIGNSVVGGGRLKTQIKSKPGILKIAFGGQVDRRQIEEDVERLIAYYRGLGYFNATIGRELRYDDSGKWLTLVFVINEGPQYKVRNVSVVGNRVFDTGDLMSGLELKAGESFNESKMQIDRNALADIYGAQGYVFADIKADPRFLEEPGWLDLVYNISEGEQYRVGRINVRIAGDHPHTRHSVVLNRISLRPGDIIDLRELRNSKRRLIASQLFLNEPHRGIAPELTVVPPDATELANRAANGGNTTSYRGQSPERKKFNVIWWWPRHRNK